MAAPVRLLFLAANPPSTTTLRLDKEVREIEMKIRAAGALHLLSLTSRWAVRPDDLLQYLNECRPHIVHFCGHGTPDESIVLEDDAGVPKVVSKAVLAHLFGAVTGNVRLIVFNACYSEPHARAVTQHVDAAIGMSGAIGDCSAIEFAASLYRALSFGLSVQDAVKQGMVALELQGLSEIHSPRLLLREGVDPRDLILVPAPPVAANPSGDCAHLGLVHSPRVLNCIPNNLPPRNAKFVGRETELQEIHRHLNNRGAIGITQQVAAYGYGGVGKSTIALEYAWRHMGEFPGGVFVIPCDTDDLSSVLAPIAPLIGATRYASDDLRAVAERVKATLENGQRALLILDNVRNRLQWHSNSWNHLLPHGCVKLITSRDPHLSADIATCSIDRLPRDVGVQLLARYRHDAARDENAVTVGDLVDWLDGLAIGVTVVGVYMWLHPHISWKRYVEALETRGLGVITRTSEHLKAQGLEPAGYARRVDEIFVDTLEALATPQRRAIEYLALGPVNGSRRRSMQALLACDGDIVLPSLPGYESNPADAVIDELIQCQLLRPIGPDNCGVSLHRVLRRCLLDVVFEKDRLLLEELKRRVKDCGCPECHGRTQVGDQFCTFCGAQLIVEVRRCSSCNAIPGPPDRYCVFCGAALPEY
jgi:hypothetical protein